MRINHNIAAMNAQRQLTVNQGGSESSLKKLSSGLRINTAADDAAGLAISEKMRAQIRGLNQAQSNAQDGISLIQTAEGSLQETTELVQRMRELAVQATNDIMTSTDREAIETELNQLRSEIDRTANTLAYNGKKLFTGEMADPGIQTRTTTELASGTTTVSGATVEITDTSLGAKAGTYTVKLKVDGSNSKVILQDADGNEYDTNKTLVTADLSSTGISSLGEVSVGDLGIKIKFGTATGNADTLADKTITLTSQEVTSKYELPAYEVNSTGLAPAGVQVSIGDNASVVGNFEIGYDIAEDGSSYVLTLTNGTDTYYSSSKIGANFATAFTPTAAELTAAENTNLNTLGNVAFEELDININLAGVATGKLSDINGQEFSAIKNPSGSRLHVGANAEDEGIVLTISDMTTGPKGLDMNAQTINVSTAANAKETLKKLDVVLGKINTERANLGAMQNRIDSTVNNLALSSENLTSAESRIRDVDMAAQMVEYSKYNILNQAAMSMLAQANSQPNQVMNLLQGL